MQFRSFLDGSYRVQSPITSQTTLMNWFTEIAEAEGAVSKKTLLPTPGVNAYATIVEAAGGRALYDTGSGRTFGVIGSRFVEVTGLSAYTLRGTVAVNTNPATIITNGDQLFITSGDKGYNYDLATNVLTEVLASGATQGGMLYGYFVAFDKTNGLIQISDLFDGTVWDPTQFQQRTIGASKWLAMLVTSDGQIVLPASKDGERWYNSGAFPFPFAPDPSALFQVGIAATFSIKEMKEGVVWLATGAQGGYTVVVAAGYGPLRISDHGVELALAQMSRVDDAIGDAYEEQGHAFYTLTFPTADKSWTYDFTTKQWHERGTWLSEENRYTYWRPVFHCSSFGKHLMADRETGVIYHMSDAYGLDVDHRVIRRVRRAPAINNEHSRIRYGKFELLLQAGLGTSTGAGVDPIIMFRMSNDFGQTWGTERQMSIGKMGQYAWRAIQWRLGQGRGRVFEISTTATTPVRITDAYIHASKSTEGAAA